MATNAKTYLDLTGLGIYDGKIKEWANSEKQIAYKTVLKSADGNNLLFYKKANATLSDTADKTIALGSSDLANKIAAFENLIPSTYDGETKKYSLVGVDSDVTETTIVAVANNINGKIGTLASLKTTAKGTVVAAINELKDVLDGLDVDEFALASVSNNVVTIKGIKETDGKIAVGTDTTKDITFEEVAMTGAAADVSIEDAAGKITATTVEGALGELAVALENQGIASKVTVEESGASGDVLKSYSFYQGVTASDDAAAKEAKKLTTINIPKDYLVRSAEVKTVETADVPYPGAKVGDKYIDFTVNTKDGEGTGTATHLYVAINDLIHPISGSTGTEVTITVSGTNEISATINSIDGSKIVYKAETSTGAGDGESVKAALTRLDGNDTVTGSVAKKIKDGIDALDVNTALPFATYAAGASGAADVITIKGGVKETNGIIEDGAGDEITLSTITSADINALFPNS